MSGPWNIKFPCCGVMDFLQAMKVQESQEIIVYDACPFLLLSLEGSHGKQEKPKEAVKKW